MASDDITTPQAERTFGIDELFFSTTDPGGRIITGNPVFVRVSGYDPEELQGRAHNVVRHPDMPRVVFRLLWRYLKDERPIAAYVKNRAKDGRHYWVVAIVAPVDDCLLSVRFKPSSPYFPAVESLYAELRGVEAAAESAGHGRDAVMDAAEEHLGRALAGLGLRDYDAFMHRFLPEELRSRAGLVAGLPGWSARWRDAPRPDPHDRRRVALIETLGAFRGVHARMEERVADVADYVRLNDALGSRSRDLVGDTTLQSLNMLLTSSRLEGAGGLSAVAGLMAAEAAAARDLTSSLNTRGDALDGVLRELAFRIAIGSLQAEMAVFFAHEMLGDAADGERDDDALAANVALLSTALADTVTEIVRMSQELAGALGALATQIQSLSRLLKVLEALQLNGTIEAAHLDDAQTAVQLLSEMRERIGTAHAEMKQLGGIASAARARARSSHDDGLRQELERIGERAALLAS